jgi:hypothetical protein
MRRVSVIAVALATSPAVAGAGRPGPPPLARCCLRSAAMSSRRAASPQRLGPERAVQAEIYVAADGTFNECVVYMHVVTN